MGERLTVPLGLKLQFDPVPVLGFRPTLVPFRLTLAGSMGTPQYNVAAGVNATKEKEKSKPPKAKTGVEKFKEDLIAKQVKVRVADKKVYLEKLEDDEMDYVAGSATQRMKRDVATEFNKMWDAMVVEHKARPGAPAGDSVGVASAYRSAKDDAGAWERAFPKYEKETREARLATKDEFGPEALDIIFTYMNGKKAPPGFSGHTHGIAADLTTTENGKTWTVDSTYEHQVGWQKSWLYKWLVEHAVEYKFYQLKTETWHWEYHDGDLPVTCWPGDAKTRAVPKPK